MNNLIKIGQVAKMYNITSDTLRLYDKMELLKPIEIRENGYRYYSYQQLDVLETILSSRSLEIPLEKVRERLANENLSSYKSLIEQQIESIESKQKKLAEMKEHTEKMLKLLSDISGHKNNNAKFKSEFIDARINRYDFEDWDKLKFFGSYGMLQFEQWGFYSNDKYEDFGGFSLAEGVQLETKDSRNLQKHYEKNGVHLCGEFDCISFWGNHDEIEEFLKALQKQKKLFNRQLYIKYLFSLTHKNLNNDYYVKIYVE